MSNFAKNFILINLKLFLSIIHLKSEQRSNICFHVPGENPLLHLLRSKALDFIFKWNLCRRRIENLFSYYSLNNRIIFKEISIDLSIWVKKFELNENSFDKAIINRI